jgi:REP element-mobilizing transposase RayT
MANTYTQCYFHLVFTVKNRNALIRKEWKNEMEMYITGIVQNHRHKLLAIGSMRDHIHILVGYNVNQLIPDLVEEIKTSTNAWIKEKRLSKFKFEWQKGYGAFTHSHSQIDNVVKYILSQEEHHKKLLFKEEYLEMLEKNDVVFNQEYLFEFFSISTNIMRRCRFVSGLNDANTNIFADK